MLFLVYIAFSIERAYGILVRIAFSIKWAPAVKKKKIAVHAQSIILGALTSITSLIS